MTIARFKLVDPEVPLFYHLVSRCVRQSWLCGRDPVTGKDYDYRKRWLVDRMRQLSESFAVEIYAYAVMSNHFHICVYYDPLACRAWSDEEVVSRWLRAFPIKAPDSRKNTELTELHRSLWLSQPETVARFRKTLGCLSAFMKHLKQPIARRANREDGCKGHFFESRFYSGALLSDDAVIAAMAYVDLNPIRAKLSESLRECAHTSIEERLQVVGNSAARLEQALGPLEPCFQPRAESKDERDHTSTVPISGRQYFSMLQSLIEAEHSASSHDQATRLWMARVAANKKRQRAFGRSEPLERWLTKRGFRALERPLPG